MEGVMNRSAFVALGFAGALALAAAPAAAQHRGGEGGREGGRGRESHQASRPEGSHPAQREERAAPRQEQRAAAPRYRCAAHLQRPLLRPAVRRSALFDRAAPVLSSVLRVPSAAEHRLRPLGRLSDHVLRSALTIPTCMLTRSATAQPGYTLPPSGSVNVQPRPDADGRDQFSGLRPTRLRSMWTATTSARSASSRRRRSHSA